VAVGESAIFSTFRKVRITNPDQLLWFLGF